MRGDAIWRVDEEMHEARRAGRSTHELRRGAERGRGEAEDNVSGDAIWRGGEATQCTVAHAHPSMNSCTIWKLALRPRARFSQVMCLEVVVSKSDAAPVLSQRPL